jgi:hypothetical protein
MTKHGQSREEWEQDLRDMQRNVLPHESIRSDQVISRRLAETPGLLKGPKQLFLFLAAILSFMTALVLAVAASSQASFALALCSWVTLVAAVVFAGWTFVASRKKQRP